METFWTICGLYDEMHTVDENEYAWGTQYFLCLEETTRAWYYEKTPMEAIMFGTKEDADSYIDKHNMRNGKGSNVLMHFPVEITKF